MRRAIIFLFVLGLGSCQPDGNPSTDVDTTTDAVIDLDAVEVDAQASIGNNDVWICHHPDTIQHNQLCIDREYPSGCYVDGDPNKFCWLLTEAECVRGADETWKRFCRLVYE